MVEKSEKTPLTTDEKIDLLKTFRGDSKTVTLEKIQDLLFRDWDEDTIKEHSAFIQPHVFDDLEMFTDHSNKYDHSVLSKINRTSTLFGEVALKEMLKNPISDITTLIMRQKVIQTIINSDDRDSLYSSLEELEDCEGGILWFWEEVTEDIQSLYDMVYFNFQTVKPINKLLNESEEILLATTFYSILISPLVSFGGPIMTALSPLIFLKISQPEIPVLTLTINLIKASLRLDIISHLPTKLKMTAIGGILAWIMFYLYNVYSSYKSAVHINTIVNIIHKKIRHIALFVARVKKLYRHCIKLGLPIGDFALEEALNRLDNMFRNDVLKQKPTLFNNKGCILKIYQSFIKNKDMLLPLMGFISQIDSYVSMAKLYCDFNNDKKQQSYCFVEFSKNTDEVRFNCKNVWHPYLDQNVVTNSINLKKDSSNILITGPNAAGKSTYIKSVAITLILAQTFGIAPADKVTMVPFEVVNSYLHIPDCKGRESLFQAEMHRCKDHLDTLESDNDRRSFVIMDEIFSSTNYKEGLSAAYAVCKKLIQYPKSVSIITTHYTPLSLLAEDNNNIDNYRFNAHEDENGELTFNYKIQKGISDQYIALKLLKLDGFDEEIIDNAMAMCDRVSLNVDLLNENNN